MPTDQKPTWINPETSDQGATPDMFKGTEVVVDVLRGLSNKTALTILLNATGFMICRMAASENAATVEARRFYRGLERCIEVNRNVILEEKR